MFSQDKVHQTTRHFLHLTGRAPAEAAMVNPSPERTKPPSPRRVRSTRVAVLVLASATLGWSALSGCSGNQDGAGSSSGGNSGRGTGGAAPSGSGGVSPGSGGVPGTGGVGSGGRDVGSGGASTGGVSGSGGATGSGGSGTGGGGSGNSGGRGGTTATGGGSGGPAGGTTGAGGAAPRFSFFVTSLAAMRQLSGSQNGFGGDLRFGEATGLAGADKICTMTANMSMPNNGKTWRAFLSVGANAPGGAVNAIDRVGAGPWYDFKGRLVAMNRAALLNTRPAGADPAILNDLPNEIGLPNHMDGAPGCTGNACPDNHHILTGTGVNGGLYGATANCNDWTSKATNSGRPRIGFSWIASSRTNWISGQDEGGCGAGVKVDIGGGSDPSNPIVGSGGGYGGIYCFALTP